MKALLGIGIIICIFFAYISYDAYHNRDEYIEACLYFSTAIEDKRECYEVYPNSHKREWVMKGIASVVGVLFLGGWYWVISEQESYAKTNSDHDEITEHKT